MKFNIFHRLAGDPYGNRTHDSALRGLRLNRLTKGPVKTTLLIYHIISSFVNCFILFFLIFLLIFHLALLNINILLMLQKQLNTYILAQ